MRKAFSYIRFSRKKQRRGSSLSRQLDFALSYCERRGWLLDHSTYRDLGLSAFHSRHAKEGSLATFLQAVKDGIVPRGSVLIVESLDRLSRDKVRVALRQFMDIIEAGIDIVTMDPEREYTVKSLDDVVGLLEPLVSMARANEESERKSTFSTALWARKRAALTERKPLGKQCPAWLRLKEDKSGYEEEAAAAAIVRRIYRLAIDGVGTYRIAAKLNQEGVLPFGGKSKLWSTTYLRNILRSRATLGEHQPHRMADGKRVPIGNPVAGYFPALLTEREWLQAQAATAQRKVGGGRCGTGCANLFTGLIIDQRDGCTMRLWSKSGKRRTNQYLTSSGARSGAPGSRFLSFPYAMMESCILRAILALDPGGIDVEGDTKRQELAALEKAVQERQERIAVLLAKIAQDDGYAVLADVVVRLEGERRRLDDQAAALRAVLATGRDEALTDAHDIIGRLEGVSGQEREDLRSKVKARIATLISRISVLIEPEGRQSRYAQVRIEWRRGNWCSIRIHSRRGHACYNAYD
jgi:DNA invertase Pin-like site-specific DNA recombinase